jgi:hypothetical protein
MANISASSRATAIVVALLLLALSVSLDAHGVSGKDAVFL